MIFFVKSLLLADDWWRHSKGMNCKVWVSVCALFWLTPAVLTCVLLSCEYLFILFLSTILTWGTEKQKLIIQALKSCTRKLHSISLMDSFFSQLNLAFIAALKIFWHFSPPHNASCVKPKCQGWTVYALDLQYLQYNCGTCKPHAFLLGFAIFSEDIRLILSHRHLIYSYTVTINNW